MGIATFPLPTMATADSIVVRFREVPVFFLYTSFHVMSPALARLPRQIQDPARTPGNPSARVQSCSRFRRCPIKQRPTGRFLAQAARSQTAITWRARRWLLPQAATSMSPVPVLFCSRVIAGVPESQQAAARSCKPTRACPRVPPHGL